MKLAVVILNWNGEKLLPQYLPSVIKHSQIDGVEVIVADNDSKDASMEVMKNQFPDIRCIELDQNYGFAEGYNQALAQVEAEYYMLLNSDVETTESWLEPLITYMDKHEDVAACGPKILDYKKKTHFEYAGGAGGFIDKYGFPFCRGRVFTTIEEDKGQYDSIKDVMWVSGCALMVRSESYWEHGGLDKDFFAHMEEIDMCWRLNNRGLRVVNIPQSTVYHLGGATLKVGSPRKVYLNFRNSLIMLYKNSDDKAYRKAIRVRRQLDYIAALKFFLFDGIKHYDAVIDAHVDFAKAIPKYENIRKDNMAKSKHYSERFTYKGSLVAAYHLFQKKTFPNFKL